jgi:hypothetical protein
MGTVTINGHAFKIATRYEEGHRCSPAEAAALQSKYEANLKPSLIKIVADGIENEVAVDAIEDAVASRAAKYQFGKRISSGRTAKAKDPISVLALQNATRDVRLKLRQAGVKLNKVKPSVIMKKAREYAAQPDYIDEAKRQLNKAKSRDIDVDDLIGDLL